MAGIKIVDLPAVGRDLAATDLFEMSLAGGTGSRKITGQEIMNASKLSVNNTPVINGTSGRIFFQDAANVLQQSSSLFWDGTNNRLGIGTSSPSYQLHVVGSAGFDNGASGDSITLLNGGFIQAGLIRFRGFSTNFILQDNSYNTKFAISTAGNLSYFNTGGNVAIGTTTDAGFRLDVNGTARVSGLLSTPAGVNLGGWYLYANGTSNASMFGGSSWIFDTVSGGIYRFRTTGLVDRLRIESTGNVLIGTTTDDGFRLDVNGTARVQGNATVQSLLVPTTNLYDIGTLGVRFRDGYFKGILLATEMYAEQFRFAATNYKILNVGGTQIAQWFGTGNLLIQNGGTFTDAGFRLDVNGTARVSGNLTFGFNTTYITTSSTGGGINAGINTFFNNGAVWIDDTSVRALDITYNNGIKIANTTRYPLSLGTSSKAVASAQLEMVSTTQGFLPPRMTQTQRNAIASPAIGLEIYQTDATEGKYIYKSSGWTYIG